MTKKKIKGRPAHEPNNATRSAIRLLAFGDFSQEQIAGRMGITVPTLVKYYKQDLLGGKTEMIAALLKKDVENALSESADARHSRHFLLKTRGGYSEKQEVQHSGEPFKLITRIELTAPDNDDT